MLQEPDFYSVIPYCGTFDDIPFYLSFSRALQRYRGLSAVDVVYWTGYSPSNVPTDLASACLELATRNISIRVCQPFLSQVLQVDFLIVNDGGTKSTRLCKLPKYDIIFFA